MKREKIIDYLLDEYKIHKKEALRFAGKKNMFKSEYIMMPMVISGGIVYFSYDCKDKKFTHINFKYKGKKIVIYL